MSNSETEVTRRLPTGTECAPASRGDLIVVSQPPPPTLQQLTAKIRKAHEDAATALMNAVVRAVEAGKDLIEAKKQVGHGNFEDYVTIECHFTMRTAQNYMRMAKYEPKLDQLLANKNAGRSYLTMSEALKFIGTLRDKKKRKASAS
jgi:hypothetical protein